MLAGRVRGVAASEIAGSPTGETQAGTAPAAAGGADDAEGASAANATPAAQSVPAAEGATELEMQPSAFAAAAAQITPPSPLATPGPPTSPAVAAVVPPGARAAAATGAAPAAEAAADDALAAVLAEPLATPDVLASQPAAAGIAVQPDAGVLRAPTFSRRQTSSPRSVGRSPARQEGSLNHWINEQDPLSGPQSMDVATDAHAAVAAHLPPHQ